MSDYQNGQTIHGPSLADISQKLSRAQRETGVGSLSGIATSGLAGMVQQETVTSMLHQILRRLSAIERKL